MRALEHDACQAQVLVGDRVVVNCLLVGGAALAQQIGEKLLVDVVVEIGDCYLDGWRHAQIVGVDLESVWTKQENGVNKPQRR